MNSDYPLLDITILGVNDTAFSSGNEAITEGRDLPWLQNTAEADVWNAWGVTYRDVWILDGENHLVDVFNVTANPLSDPMNYDTLKQMFLDAAQ